MLPIVYSPARFPQKFLIALGTTCSERTHLVGVANRMLSVMNKIVSQPKELASTKGGSSWNEFVPHNVP